MVDLPDRRSVVMLAAGMLASPALAQEGQTVRPSRVRHYVIAARDLEATCRQLYDLLEVEPTPKREGPEPTLAFGFRTRMIRVGTTLIEVVSPIREPHQLHSFFAERGGDGGFMVVMQTYDDDALLARRPPTATSWPSRSRTSGAST
ncbi:VOC family protein [Phenylobacterium aquaticum]|uniref:VOC family protein n=1 Tax=Phenylobacterium aquaticum TaxID=1763816 RepID=UPI001F5D4A1E|nr:VOC family protein [Phenylobacterium aquaticum]MCI3133462.1 VOC family protein [Phenylobacterium aquaticum]